MEQEIYSQAIAKFRAGDYQEAIQDLSRVIEINPILLKLIIVEVWQILI